MSLKIKIFILIIALLAAFGAGRWLAPTKVVTETKIVEVEKKTEEKKQDEHKKTIIVKKPDGTTTTTITDDTKTQDQTKATTSLAEDTSKTMSTDSAKVTIAMLARVSISTPGLPAYGLLVSKPVLGPLTVGAFGFTDGSGGLALGLTF